MNDHKTKHGEWVRNFVDNGSILWDGENKLTSLVMDNGSIVQLRPYYDYERKAVADDQVRHAEAVLRASEDCPDPWPGQVDDLPASGVPGYWRDRNGETWSYRNGEWCYWYNTAWDGAFSRATHGYAPFTPTVLPEDAKPLETPQDSESEDANEDSEVSNQELADLRDEATLFKSLSVKLWQDINEMAVELEEVREELRIARDHRNEIRSTIKSMSVEEVMDFLMDEDLSTDDEGN